MNVIEQFADLMRHQTVETWRDRIFGLGRDLGYEQTLLAIFPDRHAPIEAKFAFLHSNYSPDWRNRYDEEKLGYVDPTVSHCINKSLPLIWSPEIFSAQKQKEMYEEACGHGLRSGVTLPIHGAKGELGILCFVSDTKPVKHFQRDTYHQLPELACLRDFIFETSLQFMQPASPDESHVPLTPRELECLKWSAAQKSSWEIGLILHCSESVVNFHFNNIRRKFDTSSRRQAIVKAINMGLIQPF